MKKYNCSYYLALLILLTFKSYAQVGIGTTTPDDSSILDIVSTEKGILIPRINITDLLTISPITGNATTGLLVYNNNTTTGEGFYYWSGSRWLPIGHGKFWSVLGNSGTNPDTNFLGTTDAQDLRVHTNASERMRVTSTGEVAINQTSIFPGDQFTVTGSSWPINAYATGTSANVNNILHSSIYAWQDGIGAGGFFQHVGDEGPGIQLQMENTSNSDNGLVILHDGAASSIVGETRSNSITGTINVADFSYTGTDVDDHVAVNGFSAPAPGWGYGVVGSGNWYGVFAQGDSGATGTKFFTIDHPGDPKNKILRHASIESNEILNLYRGIATFNSKGKARVTLPDYYDLININPSYQLTPMGASMPNLYIEKEIENGAFIIAGGIPNKKVSWIVTSERNDPYLKKYPEKRKMVMDKVGSRAGKYFRPELYNMPKEKSMFYSKTNEVKKQPKKLGKRTK